MACNYRGDCGTECFTFWNTSNNYSNDFFWDVGDPWLDCTGRCHVGTWETQRSTTYYEHWDATDPNMPPSPHIYTLVYSLNGTPRYNINSDLTSNPCAVDGYRSMSVREVWEYYDYENITWYFSINQAGEEDHWVQATPYMWDYKVYSMIGDSLWFPSCPDGSTFDPVSGLCICSEGWDCTDPENPIPPYCLYLEGDTEVVEGDTANYRIYLGGGESAVRDIMIYISFVGSLAGAGEDYVPIYKVELLEGQSEVFFGIDTIKDRLYYENDELMNVTISIAEDSGERICADNIKTIIINNTNTDTDQGYLFTNECGTFFDENFIDWMSCNNFDEPEYPGNMLKDGTILE